jgi:hypothetical protein
VLVGSGSAGIGVGLGIGIGFELDNSVTKPLSYSVLTMTRMNMVERAAIVTVYGR